MIINLKYFGLIAEVTNKTEESIDFTEHTIDDILHVLYTKYPDLKNKDFQVAQNQELVSGTTKVTGQELALLPPFSGG